MSITSDAPDSVLRGQRVLITVKTQPRPSERYLETVCTGGLRENGWWVRLYPVPFRYLEDESKYRKYQWVRVDLRARRPNQDPRPESFTPVQDSLRTEDHLPSTPAGWAERKRLLLPHADTSMEALQSEQETTGKSVGMVPLAELRGVETEPDDRQWTQGQRQAMFQHSLFEGAPKKLEVMPWKFRISYRCGATGCRGHVQTITDWELYELYRRQREARGSEQQAIEDCRAKLEQLLGPERSPYLFVGTVLPYHSFIIGGIFSPPPEKPPRQSAQPDAGQTRMEL